MTVPIFTRFVCWAFIVSNIAFGILSYFYESGIPLVTTPLICLGIFILTVLFMRRTTWTWSWMRSMAFFIALINVVFPPTREFHGDFLLPGQVIAVVEIFSGSALFLMMLFSKRTKAWFHGDRNAPAS